MKKNKFPLVSVIIVNWNGGVVFGDCLKHLSLISYPTWELIVVDNGSTDDSLKYLRDYKNLRRIVSNKKNMGFAGGNNLGYKYAKGDYVLLLNNDTKVSREFLTKMVEKMESDQMIGVLQPKIEIMDLRGYLDNCGSYLTWSGFLQHWGYMSKDGLEFEKEADVFSTKGACMLIRKEIIEKVGLFDDDFGSYFEESDFCWRVWLSGKKVRYFPDVKIYHKVGFTSKKMDQVRVNLVSSRNRITSLIKNLGLLSLIWMLPIHLTLVMLLGFYYLVKLSPRKSWMMFGAIWENLIRLPVSIKKRNMIQRKRQVSDKELFSIIMKPFSLKEMLRHFLKVEKNFE